MNPYHANRAKRSNLHLWEEMRQQFNADCNELWDKTSKRKKSPRIEQLPFPSLAATSRPPPLSDRNITPLKDNASKAPLARNPLEHSLTCKESHVELGTGFRSGPKAFHLENFLQLLQSLQHQGFEAKLCGIRQFCACLPGEKGELPIWHLKVFADPKTAPGVKEEQEIDFYFFRDNYFSNAVHQSKLESKNQPLENRPYYFFKFIQNGNQDDPLLLIRSDLIGKYGEVVNIRNSDTLSGNFIKNKLCLPLLDFLQIENVLLQDAAEKKQDNGFKKESMRLAMLLPIAGKAGSDAEGATWYSKHGFYPLKCKSLTMAAGTVKPSQDPSFYYAAIEHVRSTTLSKLHSEIFGEAKVYQTNLIHLWESYLKSPLTKTPLASKPAREFVSNEGTPWTIADLASAVFLKSLSQAEASSRLSQAAEDLGLFYRTCLECRRLSPHSSEAAKTYNLALDAIGSHHVWIKRAVPLEGELSYAEFIKTPHASFIEIVSKIHQTAFTRWIALYNHYFKGLPDTKFVENESAVDIIEHDAAELERIIAAINLNMKQKKPFQRFHALTKYCTLASVIEDPSKTYWQAWIKLPAAAGKTETFIELVIKPQGDKQLDIQLIEDDYKNTIAEYTADREGKIKKNVFKPVLSDNRIHALLRGFASLAA